MALKVVAADTSDLWTTAQIEINVLSAQQATEPAAGPPSLEADNFYALVVGIANYQNTDPLPAVASNDARAVADTLADPDYGGYPSQNVRLLLDSEATQAALTQALDALAQQIDTDSTVLFYFSGHTAQGETDEERYLLPVDVQPDALAQTALSDTMISQALDGLPAGTVIVVLDCSFAGAFGQKMARPGRAVLAAARGDEQAYLLPEGEYSLFTHHLLAGLRGGAYSADGFIRAAELFHYVLPRAAAGQTAQHPLLRTSRSNENVVVARYLGGKRTYLGRLSASSREALAWAEGARRALDGEALTPAYLLAGLFQKEDGPTRGLLTLIDGRDAVVAQLEAFSQAPADSFDTIESTSIEDWGALPLSPPVEQALAQAQELAGASAPIRSRHLLAGLIAVPESGVARWIAGLLGVDPPTLVEQTVGMPEIVPGLDALRQASRRLQPPQRIPTRPWYVTLKPPDQPNLLIGQEYTFTLRLHATEQPAGKLLRIPENTLDLTLFVETSGLQLAGERIRTLPVVEGRPMMPTAKTGPAVEGEDEGAEGEPEEDELAVRQLDLHLTPLLSGERELTVQLDPGGHVEGVKPVRLACPVQIEAPAELPDIPELVDRRTVPDPQPDVMLYVALVERPTGQQVVVHVTCRALGLDRQECARLDLDSREMAGLRQAAIRAAADADQAAPAHSGAGQRTFGALLFDRLMPPGSPLRHIYWAISELARRAEHPLAWLVIADQEALLPWEMVLPYSGEQIDDFLGARFNLAHWVGRQNFRLASEAPLWLLDLSHYHQKPDTLPRWQRLLGGDEMVYVEEQSGHLALMQPGSPFYGLHLLRYAEERRDGRIASAAVRSMGDESGQAVDRTKALLVYDRRLDFTRRRPVVGLSFVANAPAQRLRLSDRDTDVENGWVMPLLHAGSTALVGARWLVSAEADQLFYSTFYRLIRHGVSLGQAVREARLAVRQVFSYSSDWLAYAYYGHPVCQPYVVEPAEGFALFEVLDHPLDQAFQSGATYRFRASYRAQLPTWYNGRLRSLPATLQPFGVEADDLSVLVMPLDGRSPERYTLQPVSGGDDYQKVVEVSMPDAETTLPVLVQFTKGGEELQTLTLNFDVTGEGA